MPLTLHSTNHACPDVDFKTALLAGLAPDKGLYTSSEYPKFSNEELLGLASMEYPELGYAILSKLVGDQFPAAKLKAICKDAYDFPVPVVKLSNDENTYVLHLDKGPTASFKDFAARAMARLMALLVAKGKKDMLILTATSGDTGGAVASAFHGIKNIKVCVLFPKDEVSELQRKQMTTLGDNVQAIAVDGKFDDCQALVKQAFADQDLATLNLSSANSINIGRLLPQSIYYFWAYFKACEDQVVQGVLEPIVVSVPSGNFGNLMGGLIAKQMGLPISKFIAAVNENDEFPRFLESGVYTKIEPSINCLSNAMNVGHPSNLARVVDLYGGVMDEQGTFHEQPDLEKLRKDIFSVSISDEETKFIIETVHHKLDYVLEPHGAVGWGGLQRYRGMNEITQPCITIETADPAKFPVLIQQILGIDPPVPPSLQQMQGKEESYVTLKNLYIAFKDFLIENYAKI
ncbi:MAG TPA: threonine synthase [Candidatus Lokiarchaeia archaeon]|nr:threonine synthase [Candidatus Lokiarchaeia archaeon]